MIRFYELVLVVTLGLGLVWCDAKAQSTLPAEVVRVVDGDTFVAEVLIAEGLGRKWTGRRESWCE